jgi:hypothetical protein
MGTVHGVYLKYVGLSALSYAGLTYLATNPDGSKFSSTWELLGHSLGSLSANNHHNLSLLRALPALYLGYSTVVNGVIAVFFKLEWGMSLIGKDGTTGQIPLWSYLALAPFHIPTRLYTWVHQWRERHCTTSCAVATQVQPGWWVGGWQGNHHQPNNQNNTNGLLPTTWSAVIDATVCTGTELGWRSGAAGGIGTGGAIRRASLAKPY